MTERALTLVRPMFVYSKTPGSFAAGTTFADGQQNAQLRTSSGSTKVFVYLAGAGTLAEAVSVADTNSNEGYQIVRATFKS